MKLLCFIVFILFGCSSKQIIFDSTSVSTLESKIHVDRFDNVYLLTSTGEIHMYNPDGRLIYSFANDQIGQITSMDVSNPQNILVFYADFGIIQILDNTLSEISNLNIANLGYMDIVSVASANDGFFWIYDPINFKLIKLNAEGQKTMESNRLSDYNLDPFEPIYMIERDNKVFISTNHGKLLVFDNFGQYIKSFQFDGIKRFMVDNEILYYITNKKLTRYDIRYLTSEVFPFEDEFIDYDYNRSSGIVILEKDESFKRVSI